MHLPVFQIPAAWRRGGKRTVPVLLTGDKVLTESSEIVELAEAAQPGLLFPDDEAEAGAVRAWMARFDKDLGPAARRIAYFHMLPERARTIELLTADPSSSEPFHERALMAIGFPLARGLMRRALKIDRAGYERSVAKARDSFDAVGEALGADGRYLVGDRFTAADLSFAALATPLIVPEGFPWAWPTIESLPEPMQDELRRWREHPAGVFVQRLYREHRPFGQGGKTRVLLWGAR